MLGTSSLFWLSSIRIITQNLDLSEGTLVEKWIEQYQDHFDPCNDKMWMMRYYENNQFYHQSGPIFIMIGGEGLLTPQAIEIDVTYEMANTYGAMMYSIEHRYYGKSHPVPDISLENLRYLSVSQALADIALFIEKKKKELNSPEAFTMVFGCSYAGNLAAWMRIKYPNLVQGALARSAPIYVEVEFSEYFFNVESSIRHYDENCAMNIETAFLALGELLDNPAINSIKVANDFNLCSSNSFQPSDMSYMMLTLANIFAFIITYNKIHANGRTTLENTCNLMRENGTISPYFKLAELFNKAYLKDNSCINAKYSEIIASFLTTSWESEMVKARLWTYQMCTELGYFMTLSSPVSIFGNRVPLQYFTDLCGDIFKEGFKLEHLNHNIREIDHLYNSKLPSTTNIIFVNGDLDPWHSISVLSDLNADSPAIIINDATHCESMGPDQARGKKNIAAAKCFVSFTIDEWLHKWFRN